MTAAAFIRVEVTEKIIALIEAQSGGAVQVADGFPGPFLQADQIWLTGEQGPSSLDVFAGRARPTDDRFVVSFLCVASVPGRTRAEAKAVVQSFASMVLNAVHDGSLDDFAVNTSYVISARIGQNTSYSEGRDEGHAAFWSIDVECHTRTNYSGADAQ